MVIKPKVLIIYTYTMHEFIIISPFPFKAVAATPHKYDHIIYTSDMLYMRGGIKRQKCT